MHGSVYDFINISLNADEFKDINFTRKFFLSLIPSLFLSKGNLIVKIMQIE